MGNVGGQARSPHMGDETMLRREHARIAPGQRRDEPSGGPTPLDLVVIGLAFLLLFAASSLVLVVTYLMVATA